MLIDENIIGVTPSNEYNGCGPKGWGGWVRDKVFGLSLHQAGDIHDCHYYWIKKMQDKSHECQRLKDFDHYLFRRLQVGRPYADKIFLKNMLILNSSSKSRDWVKKLRLPIIKAYFMAVQNFGSMFL